jgi:lipooligosaccharide transport system permease protein
VITAASLRTKGPARLVERNAHAYLRLWPMFMSGFAEPVLFLFSIGIGVGALVNDVQGPDGPVPYDVFVAPGLLAAAAMNGAVMDTTFGFFVKFKYVGSYHAILATPMRPRDIAGGEITWSLLRGAFYATLFLIVMVAMGLVESWWGILAVPASVLIGFAFASAGLAGSTFMRSWLDFDFIFVAIMPMFLFSGTFFPLSEYPDWLQGVVRLTPLYQGVVLVRALVLGAVEWGLLWHAIYLLVMGIVGWRVASHRLKGLMQP